VSEEERPANGLDTPDANHPQAEPVSAKSAPRDIPPTPIPPPEESRSSAESPRKSAPQPSKPKPARSKAPALTPEQIRERLDSFADMARDPHEAPAAAPAEELGPAVSDRADLIPAPASASDPESKKPAPSEDALDRAKQMLQTVFEPQLQAVRRSPKMQDKLSDWEKLVAQLKTFAEDPARDDAVCYQAHVLAMEQAAQLGQVHVAIGFADSLTSRFVLDAICVKLAILEQADFEVPGAAFREPAQREMLTALGALMDAVQRTNRFEEDYRGSKLADVLLELHDAVQRVYARDADDFSAVLRAARETQARFRMQRIQNASDH
jgi:hypothetical protein